MKERRKKQMGKNIMSNEYGKRERERKGERYQAIIKKLVKQINTSESSGLGKSAEKVSFILLHMLHSIVREA